MYRIIGADQKEYGPVNADQIRQWIATSRANASTKVQPEGSTEWKPLSEFPEFADALSTSNPLPSFSASAQPSNIQAPQTSGMAIASLVLGILSLFTCGLTGIPGLILGILALAKINKNQGRLSGKGLAIAGICTSGILMLLSIPILAGMLLPALAKAKQKARTIQCINNMKQLGLAVRIYSSDHKDQLPSAANWSDAIFTNVSSSNIFRCPTDLHQTCGYAYNSKLSGLNESEINPRTVLFFESDGGWNASGGSEQMLSRHGNRTVVCFVDGSVMQLSPSNLSTLRWDP
ncbi:MAG: hypothetical protein JWQ71_1589 [Pedosphaera sp.]|nr:hypothetical protein [Pedosphaera sp.]